MAGLFTLKDRSIWYSGTSHIHFICSTCLHLLKTYPTTVFPLTSRHDGHFEQEVHLSVCAWSATWRHECTSQRTRTV